MAFTVVSCKELDFRAARLIHVCTQMKGEGEVKILSRLLRPWADVQPEDTHVVIANDSDVVLMALVTPARNVFVLAEPGRVARRGVASLAAGSAAAASKKGRQGRARVAAGARGLPMTMGFTCFSVTALQRLWLHKHPFLRGATSQVWYSYFCSTTHGSTLEKSSWLLASFVLWHSNSVTLQVSLEMLV